MNIQPFTLNVSQAVLDDLQGRLAMTRWPDEVEGTGWTYGSNLGYMKEFADYWQHRYDWRKQEADLNRFAHFKTEIDGTEIQFIHERGKGPNPTPLILLHGWPDSIYRYLKMIPMLTDPAAYGGDPNNSFDVIVPSLFDDTGSPKRPVRPQFMKHAAERFWRLMTEGLGYARFVAGGGDGGGAISQSLGVLHPESLIGIHLTDIGFYSAMAQYSDLSEAEQQYLQQGQIVSFQEGAYAMLLGTKPQTFAYGLNDSPVGWASLVVEKFRSWSDCDGDIEKSFTKDELLTNIMLYWVQNAIDPRGYREEWTSPSLQADEKIEVPVGFAFPPKDLSLVPPREFVERTFKNIQRWTVLPRGGHFVAMEDPASMAHEIQAFVHDLKVTS